VAALVALTVSVGAPRPARASPSAKLTYLRGPGTEKCPNEAALRAAVAARLGFDVFFPWARRTVVAEIARGPRGYRAKLQIVGEDGVVLGVRAIDATSDSCEEVTRALALAISIAVDDFGLDDVPPPPTPDPTPSPTDDPRTGPDGVQPAARNPRRTTERREVPSTTTSTPTNLRLSASLAPRVSFLLAPATSVGLEAAFDVRFPRPFSLGVDLRGDLPASSGGIETNVLAASLVPCVRAPSPLLFCAVGSLGEFHETGVGISHATSGDALCLTLGARVGVELPLGPRFFLLGDADGAFVLIRHEVTLGSAPPFRLPVLSPSLSAGAGVLF
jgi:hypothetical protein